MSLAPLPAHLAVEIDQLHCGTILLTVPLLRGAVQVGSVGPLPTATIEVRKSPSVLMVRRTDGAALQAQLVRHADGDSTAVREDVFTEPVPAVVIRRIPRVDGAPEWLVTSGNRTRRHSDLVQLVTTIVTFGVAKQRRNAHPPRLRLPA